MIARYYKKRINLRELRLKTHLNREGVSMAGLSSAAESLGFRTMGASVKLRDFIEESPLPCIVHWNNKHFAVVYKIKKNKIYVADPAFGMMTYSLPEFGNGWRGGDPNIATDVMELKGRVLLLEPTPAFYEQDEKQPGKPSVLPLFHHLYRYKKLILQLVLGMVVGTVLQLLLPFLTQSIVDVGINQRNLNFIYLILMAQIALFVGQTGLSILRGWILLHINSRINISLISDFLMKLMKLPMNFFDSRTAGDIVKRIDDHARIETFLTGTAISIIFSFFNLVIFGLVLAYYNRTVFVIFLIGSTIYIVWAVLFLRRRRTLDYKNFALESANKGSIFQLIFGIQEIKLNNAERQKRWDWESIQAKLFKNQIKVLHLEQYQNNGGALINEIKNVLISAIAAKAVMGGQMTLGMMLAVQFILGQLNLPLLQIVGFLHTTQDAMISIERLREVHEEEDEGSSVTMDTGVMKVGEQIGFSNVGFRYGDSGSPAVLQSVNIKIPANKITAIVGPSGGGKTTLGKLLLKLYEPTEGEIYY
jgi:ATP-binding cassette subfamily B protein